MADYKLQARIPQETADKLFKVIKELQEVTTGADVTASSITRSALENFIKDHENTHIKVELDKSKISNEELERVIEIMIEFDKLAKSEGEKYIFNQIARKLMIEKIDRY